MGVLVALDWGTTHVRAALLDVNGVVLDERHGNSGVGQFSADEFQTRFNELTREWPCVPALACGMIGSRQGWREAAYLKCPATTDGLAGAVTRFESDGRSIAIVPGLTVTHRHTEHDVMRGEETQIAGLVARDPNFTGVVVLPGTHSKWARLEGGAITDFQTYMTGEFYAALSQHTILRHSMEPKNDAWDDTAFNVAFGDTFMTKGSDWARFFSLRAGHLILGEASGHRREQLSGYLIGAEFAAAAQDGFDGEQLTIIADQELGHLYKLGANVLGKQADVHQGTDLIWPALFHMAREANLV